MSQSESPDSNLWAAEYSEADKQALYPTYPDSDAYDLSAINFRSNTRRIAREVYDTGSVDAKQINDHIATSINMLLSKLLGEPLNVTTTQHDEKVIITNRHAPNPHPIDIGSFGHRMRRFLPDNTNKRQFCNEFRDLMFGIVYNVIEQVHEYLAGLGVPPYPASKLP